MAVIATDARAKADSAAIQPPCRRAGEAHQRVFWDEKQGMYFDRNEKTGKRVT